MKRTGKVMALLLAFSVMLSSITVNAAGAENNVDETMNYDVDRLENGNVIIHEVNEYGEYEGEIVLDNTNNVILYNGQEVGVIINDDNDVDFLRTSLKSSTWKKCGTSTYKITATQAGVAAVILGIMAAAGGGIPAAALSAFAGTTAGGTLTLTTYEKKSGNITYLKSSWTYKTSTGEVYGPFDNIKTFYNL